MEIVNAKLAVLVGGVLSLSLGSAALAQTCVPPAGFPNGYVTGYIVKVYADRPTALTSQGFYVKFCKRDAPWYCAGGTTCLENGNSGFYIQHPEPANGTWATWDFFAWSDDPNDPFGSETVPIDSVSFRGQGLLNMRLAVPPRPFVPTPLSPINGQTSTSTVTGTWRDGLDSARRFSQWPARYDVYYKQWPFAGLEPAAWAVATADFACATQPNCSISIGGLPEGFYKWYVVAKLDVTAAGYAPNTIMSNQSSASSPGFFKIGTPSATPAYQGCYFDQPVRALPRRLYPTGGVTVQTCTAAAKAAGYRFAGLQYGSQCWAGNTPLFDRAAESDCNTACTANTAQKCGGRYRNSIWSTGLQW